VQVTDVPPTIVLSGDSRVKEGSNYELTLGDVTDPGDDRIADYSIDWGDETVEHFQGLPSDTRTHVYADGPDSYTVSVNLKDEDGMHPRAGTKIVEVASVAPTPATSEPTMGTDLASNDSSQVPNEIRDLLRRNGELTQELQHRCSRFRDEIGADPVVEAVIIESLLQEEAREDRDRIETLSQSCRHSLADAGEFESYVRYVIACVDSRLQQVVSAAGGILDAWEATNGGSGIDIWSLARRRIAAKILTEATKSRLDSEAEASPVPPGEWVERCVLAANDMLGAESSQAENLTDQGVADTWFQLARAADWRARNPGPGVESRATMYGIARKALKQAENAFPAHAKVYRHATIRVILEEEFRESVGDQWKPGIGYPIESTELLDAVGAILPPDEIDRVDRNDLTKSIETSLKCLDLFSPDSANDAEMARWVFVRLRFGVIVCRSPDKLRSRYLEDAQRHIDASMADRRVLRNPPDWFPRLSLLYGTAGEIHWFLCFDVNRRANMTSENACRASEYLDKAVKTRRDEMNGQPDPILRDWLERLIQIDEKRREEQYFMPGEDAEMLRERIGRHRQLYGETNHPSL